MAILWISVAMLVDGEDGMMTMKSTPAHSDTNNNAHHTHAPPTARDASAEPNNAQEKRRCAASCPFSPAIRVTTLAEGHRLSARTMAVSQAGEALHRQLTSFSTHLGHLHPHPHLPQQYLQRTDIQLLQPFDNVWTGELNGLHKQQLTLRPAASNSMSTI